MVSRRSLSTCCCSDRRPAILGPATAGTAPLGSVIILTAEDDIADTVRPRLEAACADLNRVHVIKAVKIQEKGTCGLHLSADITFRLELVIRRIGDVKLVIIDPISAYMGRPGKMDSYRSTDVRATLRSASGVGQRCKVAVVVIDQFQQVFRRHDGPAPRTQLNRLRRSCAGRLHHNARRDDDEDRRLLLAAKRTTSGKFAPDWRSRSSAKPAPPPVFEAYPAIKWEDDAGEHDRRRGRWSPSMTVAPARS